MAKKSKKPVSFKRAMKVLEGEGVPKVEFGRHTKSGSVTIDHKALEALRKSLPGKRKSRVRFVALNAPFKRRSPISPG
jgi:hypothetical protein